MEINLKKKPKNPIIIEGFPGFGLVSTIACEFLIDHLKTEQIGRITYNEMPAMVAIHENSVVEPLGIFYNKKHNIIILHAITPSTGSEWKLADMLIKLAKELKAKEIISLEGVSGAEAGKSRTFYYTSHESTKKKLEKIGLEPLKEGIIMGVTGAVLIKAEKIPVSCVFAETYSNLPDSKAAANIVKALDKYLGLGVDSDPLIHQAEKFENKLKSIMAKSQEAQEISEKKKLSYVG